MSNNGCAVRLAVVTLALLPALSVTAQSRADFSGAWRMDEARSESAHYEGFVGPVSLVITQSDKEMTIEVTRGEKTTTDHYLLYASERVAGAVPPSAPSFKSYWDGSRLVSETLRIVNDATVRTKEVRSLSADGSEMTVEATVIVEHGYTLAGTKNYGSGKDVFVRR